MYVVPCKIANTGAPVPHELSKFLGSLNIGNNLRDSSFKIIEYKSNDKTRKFFCGVQGEIWELWLHEDGNITPPILKKSQIPYIAEQYFLWKTGGYSKGKQAIATPSEHIHSIHGILYWCDLYIEQNRESSHYYEDGLFIPGTSSWFPEPDDF